MTGLRVDELNALRRALMHALMYSENILDKNILEKEDLEEFKQFKQEYKDLLKKLRSIHDLQIDNGYSDKVRDTGILTIRGYTSGI